MTHDEFNCVENERGGEARQVVAEIASLVGVDLADEVVIEHWHPDNMHRVVDAVRALRRAQSMTPWKSVDTPLGPLPPHITAFLREWAGGAR